MDQKRITPRLLLKEITSKEYTELKILSGKEMIGLDREDYRAAYAACAMHRSWGGESKVSDFLPMRIEIEQTQTADEMLALLCGPLLAVETPDGNLKQNVDCAGP